MPPAEQIHENVRIPVKSPTPGTKPGLALHMLPLNVERLSSAKHSMAEIRKMQHWLAACEDSTLNGRRLPHSWNDE